MESVCSRVMRHAVPLSRVMRHAVTLSRAGVTQAQPRD